MHNVTAHHSGFIHVSTTTCASSFRRLCGRRRGRLPNCWVLQWFSLFRDLEDAPQNVGRGSDDVSWLSLRATGNGDLDQFDWTLARQLQSRMQISMNRIQTARSCCRRVPHRENILSSSRFPGDRHGLATDLNSNSGRDVSDLCLTPSGVETTRPAPLINVVFSLLRALPLCLFLRPAQVRLLNGRIHYRERVGLIDWNIITIQ